MTTILHEIRVEILSFELIIAIQPSITIKEKSCVAFFCFATDTFMELFNSSGLSVTHSDPRDQIN